MALFILEFKQHILVMTIVMNMKFKFLQLV